MPDTNLTAQSATTTVSAVKGEHTTNGEGVTGVSAAGTGVHGSSQSAFGVLGESKTGRGVVATSDTDYGLRAASRTSAGIRGSSVEGRGVEGWATKAEGVVGISTTGNGVWGQTEGAGTGVLGTSKSGSGVHGISTSGVGVHGKGGRLAALFEGDVEVTGDIRLANADCAEDFDMEQGTLTEPGTVMVLSDTGALRESDRPHDKRVAGVISGAGEYRPGLVLDTRPSPNLRQPVALLGKVYCKVDAQYAPIEIGDLLTTSATPGHAMKAGDPLLAFGAVIGKALRPLASGQALIPILIALQ